MFTIGETKISLMKNTNRRKQSVENIDRRGFGYAQNQWIKIQFECNVPNCVRTATPYSKLPEIYYMSTSEKNMK